MFNKEAKLPEENQLKKTNLVRDEENNNEREHLIKSFLWQRLRANIEENSNKMFSKI